MRRESSAHQPSTINIVIPDSDPGHQTSSGATWRLAFALFVLGAARAMACPIPVFQYALENWPADPYELTVYQRGALSKEGHGALEMLQAAAARETVCANIKLAVHDLDKDTDIEGPAQTVSLPFLQVRYPRHSPLRDPVWSGSLSPESVQSVLHSPVREKLGSLLLARKTAVWVLLEGQERARNDAAFAILRQELARLEKTLVLPSSAEWEDQTVTIYNTISFDIIRLRRDDPNEQVLIQTLLRSEKDLVELGAVPMVFPIYGRGLVLYALVDKGINRWTIEDAGTFLTGPCSCQIKAGNPGLDLLLSVDWEAQVQPLSPAAPVGTGGFLRRLEQAQDELDD